MILLTICQSIDHLHDSRAVRRRRRELRENRHSDKGCDLYNRNTYQLIAHSRIKK